AASSSRGPRVPAEKATCRGSRTTRQLMTNWDDKVHHSERRGPILNETAYALRNLVPILGKSMKKLAVAMAATALLGAVAAAEQTAQPRQAQAPAAPPKMAR